MGKFMQKYCEAMLVVMSIMAIMVLFGWLGFDAMDKEMQARQALWKSRCDSWGENIPAQMEPYCRNTGV